MSDKTNTCANCIYVGIHNIETSNVPNWCNNQDSYLSGRIRHYLGTTCDKHVKTEQKAEASQSLFIST